MDGLSLPNDSEDDHLFGEDIAFSQESVDRRLGRVHKRSKSSRNLVAERPKQRGKCRKAGDRVDGSDAKKGGPEESGQTDSKKKTRSFRRSATGTKSSGGKEEATSSEEVSEVISVEDDEESEKGVIRLNIKVYKRKESDIIIIKTLVVALYRADPIRKLVTYVSKNLDPKPENYLQDIKVYFDGDQVSKEVSISEIGIDDEEQLEIKVPFECSWSS
ncbi:hypothetical protein OJ253_685 [Cryptosporidium canis]|uniref:Rad60/SUMO-like domain-containing protein n=1 Tax=Cryptosporidium canis TaxID=195482 RepID=A0A9D5DIP7_9CRYT|nr:hypothetical protein OJ253_685 [Cryptosporidium canis]